MEHLTAQELNFLRQAIDVRARPGEMAVTHLARSS